MRDNFFHPSLGPVGNLGEGVEAWRGYHSSVRPTGLGLTLNLGKWSSFLLSPILSYGICWVLLRSALAFAPCASFYNCCRL